MRTDIMFQQGVREWMNACFTAEVVEDPVERNRRFLEEALELVQAGELSRAEAHRMVDYVFSRPAGEVKQEVGGVMVTLAAWCGPRGINMHECGDVELERIWHKIAQIRAKQAEKPKPLAANDNYFGWTDTNIQIALVMAQSGTAEQKEQARAFFATHLMLPNIQLG